MLASNHYDILKKIIEQNVREVPISTWIKTLLNYLPRWRNWSQYNPHWWLGRFQKNFFHRRIWSQKNPHRWLIKCIVDMFSSAATSVALIISFIAALLESDDCCNLPRCSFRSLCIVHHMQSDLPQTPMLHRVVNTEMVCMQTKEEGGKANISFYSTYRNC
jgi:hypothetical protein